MRFDPDFIHRCDCSILGDTNNNLVSENTLFVLAQMLNVSSVLRYLLAITGLWKELRIRLVMTAVRSLSSVTQSCYAEKERHERYLSI